MVYLALIGRCLVGTIFVVSACTKLHSPEAYRAFAGWLADLPIPAARHRLTPPVLACCECAVVVLATLPATAGGGLMLAAAVLAAFTAGTAIAVRRGTRAACRCFGASANALSSGHVARNALLLALAASAAVAASLRPGPVRAEGIALSLAAAVVLALMFLFFDDVAALIADDGLVYDASKPGRAEARA